MKLLKIGVVVLLVLAIATLAGTFFLYYTTKLDYESEKEQRVLLEGEKAKLEQDKTKTEAELTQVREARDNLAQQLEEEVKLAREFSQKYEQEKKAREAAEKKLTDVTAERDQLKDEYESYKRTADEKMTTLQNENDELKKKNKELADRYSGLALGPAGAVAEAVQSVQGAAAAEAPAAPAEQAGQTTVESAPAAGQPSVELPPITVTPENVPQVLLLNKQFNFLVTNIGKPDGLSIGDTLSILREDVLVARVKVSKFYDSLSACDIQWQKEGEEVKEGDRVSKES